MKRMKIWHRLVVLLGSLIFLALAVFILFLVGQGPEKTFAFLQAQANPLHYLLVAIIFLVLFIAIAAAGTHSQKPQRMIIYDTALGQVRVANSAVEDLALRAVRRLKGIRDAEVTVEADDDGMVIAIDVTVLPDMNLPQLSEEARQRVSEYIREIVGIPVNHVTINIARISNEARPRVE
jgi:hypothetical protein